MSAVAPLPLPLPAERVPVLSRLVEGLDANALYWLSGYTAGLAARSPEAQRIEAVPAATAATSTRRLSIVYGSQTGNARRAAEQLAGAAEAAGIDVRLLRADAYPLRELKDERLLQVVISTQGDGDPPDDARAFVEFLEGRRAPKLPDLHFAVLALGDSSYPQFCAIGRRIDARLAELGGTRSLPLAEADLDIDTTAAPWRQRAVDSARSTLGTEATPLATVTPLRSAGKAASATREQPYSAELLLNQPITAPGSTRDIRHIELSLEGSGLHYIPGDALGIWPENPPDLVAEVLDVLGLDGDTEVTHGEQTQPLRTWLGHKRELTRLHRPLLAAHATLSEDAGLQQLLAPDHTTELAALFEREQIVDLLRRVPAPWQADTLVAALRPLVPRLYSIASSAAAIGGDEVHLTVAHVAYQHDGRARWGAASHHLSALAPGARVPVYVEANDRFRLPADDDRDVIMIGPGTGVAPFRAFVQQRGESGARGRNWLFFGNPHFHSDFLYQLEWQAALRDGRLHELDLAFSRDQAEKIYVQQRLRQRGRDLFDWLQGGAHLYVCGAIAMAKDVHTALLAVIGEHGGLDAEAAGDYLNHLQQDGRYARDVY